MKKRILALALVVLMVVGVIPVTALATENNVEEVPEESYTGKVYDSALTADSVKPTPSTSYNSSSSYWVPLYKAFNDDGSYNVTYQTAISGTPATAWAHNGIGSAPNGYMTFTGDHRVSFFGAYAYIDKHYSEIYQKDLAGLDIAVDLDIIPDANAAVGSQRNFSFFEHCGASNVWGISYVNITVEEKNGEKVFTLNMYSNGGDAVFYPITTIPTDKYTNVRVVFDFGNTNFKYYVYVDGEYMGSNDFLNASYANSVVAYQAANSDHPKGATIGGYQTNGVLRVNVKTFDIYLYDDDADGVVTDSVRKANVATELKHYQDFDGLAEGSYNANTGSLFDGNIQGGFYNGSANVVDDGNGGKALTWGSGSGVYYQLWANLSSGTNFVYSTDYKLTAAPQNAEAIFGGCAYNSYAGDYGRDFNVGILWLHTDGGIYLGSKTDETSSGLIINGIGGDIKAKKLCTLSYDVFTTLTLAVNVEKNTFRVYVNGVDATGELQFLCDSDLALLKATANFANGFGLTHRRIPLNSCYQVDNISLYAADNIVNKNVAPLNGYVKNGEKLYYYENGQVIPYKALDGDIVKTDKSGAVYVAYGEEVTYPAALNALYVNLGNGDKVLCDGVYGGLYTAKSGNRYCYGADKTRVTDTSAPYFLGDFAYNVAEYGVASEYQGIHNNRLFLNGQLQKDGIFTYLGDKYLIGEEGIFVSDIITIDGQEWFFNPANEYKGEKIVIEGDVAVDTNTGAKYDDVKDAIDNIDENGALKLYGDMSTNEALIIDKGITLNLNGNTLTSSGVVITAGTTIITSKDNKGYINVPKGQLMIARTTEDVISYYEEGKGYTFAEVKKQDTFLNSDVRNDGFTFVFRPSLDDSTVLNKSIFGNGNASGVKLVVELVDSDGQTIRNFVYSYSLVADAYNNGKALKLTVKNLKYEHGEIKVVYSVVSNSGMTCKMEAGVYTPSNGRISILGDSICTYNGISIGGRPYYGPGGEGENETDVTDVSQTWWGQLIADKGYKLEVNQSRGGAPVCTTGYGGAPAKGGVSFIYRMGDIGNPDIIAIFGGTNDSWAGSPIGEYKYSDWNDEDLKTFRPAYAYMLDYLTKNHPNAKIVVIINCALSPEIDESIIEICNHYGVTYVELSDACGGYQIHPDKAQMNQFYEEIKDYFD